VTAADISEQVAALAALSTSEQVPALAAMRAAIRADADAALAATMRRLHRTPKYKRNDAWYAALDAADAAYAEACRTMRTISPGTPEFRRAHPDWDRSGRL